MGKFISLVKRSYQRWSQYYLKSGDLITMDNTRTLFYVSIWTVLILGMFMALTPLILPKWEPSVYHYMFVPVSVLFFLVAFYFRNRRHNSKRCVTILCVAFQVMVYSFIIMMDAMTGAEEHAGFMPVICIMLPVLFTMRLLINYGLLFIAEVVYIVITIQYKTPTVGRYNIFTSLVGVVCAMVMTAFVTWLRLQSYESQLEYQRLSICDTLSNIFNKQAMIEAANHYLSETNPHTSCALLFFDLDDFKQINDTCGHLTGDNVLRCVGNTLRDHMEADDIVGRFGGDEYLVLLKNVHTKEAVEKKCRVLDQVLSENCTRVAGTKVTLSIGGVVADDQMVDFDRLLFQSDQILYQAKALSGKGQFIVRKYQSNTQKG